MTSLRSRNWHVQGSKLVRKKLKHTYRLFRVVKVAIDILIRKDSLKKGFAQQHFVKTVIFVFGS